MFRARALMHAKAVFTAVHASVRLFMFGASLPSSSATWRAATSQSGCLSRGSLLTKQLRQSATRHRLVGRPSIGGLRVETALQRSASIRQNLWKSNQGSKAMQRPRTIAKAQKGLLVLASLGTGHQPNWAFKRTPTWAKASPLSWPMLVPFSRCAPFGAA